MHFYLGISDADADCALCSGNVPSGLNGHVDDVPPHPVCISCLAAHDAPLVAILLLAECSGVVSAAMGAEGDAGGITERVRELLHLLIRSTLPSDAGA